MIEISKHANLVSEAIMILYRIAQEEKDDYAEYAHLFQDDAKEYEKKCTLINDIIEYTKSHLSVKEERIQYFFKESEKGFEILASFALLWNPRAYDSTLEYYRERNATMDDDKRLEVYLQMLNQEEPSELKKNQAPLLAMLFDGLQASNYGNEQCWEILKIFQNQREYFNEVADIISQVLNVFDHFKTEINEMEDEFYRYWNERNQNIDLVKTICNKVDVQWHSSEKGTVIVPYIFMPKSLVITLDENENKSKDIIYIGIFHDERFEMSHDGLTKDEVIRIGKLIGDKSKLDILELLSQRSFYGKEIADTLNLSTATISYHMNQLLGSGFVKTVIESGRVYYEMNAEKIGDNLDRIKRYINNLARK